METFGRGCLYIILGIVVLMVFALLAGGTVTIPWIIAIPLVVLAFWTASKKTITGVTEMSANQTYLESARKQFLYYKTLGEKAMNQLEPEQLFTAYNEDTNSIATIVAHLGGNMLSRWTDFLTTDGEKDWRDRDAEFGHGLSDKEQLLDKWNEGWNCLFHALDSLSPGQLEQIIYIRNEGHTVIEAINRQLAHYPYHVGQIVYAAKLLKKRMEQLVHSEKQIRAIQQRKIRQTEIGPKFYR